MFKKGDSSSSSSKAAPTPISRKPVTTPPSKEDEEESLPINDPPPYSGPVVQAQAGPSRTTSSSDTTNGAALRQTPLLPNLDFTKVSIPNCTVSKDGTVVVTTSASLSSDSRALTNFIRDQASLPPLPCIRIVGSPPPGQTKPDFDIKVNMLRYFLPAASSPPGPGHGSFSAVEKGHGWSYIKLVDDHELAYRGRNEQTTSPSLKMLEQWTAKYCKESSSNKTFVLDRQLTNWNQSYIEGQIRSLIAATGYTRHVSVTFPVQYTKVVVQPPRSGSEGFFHSLFAPLLDKKRYEVVKAVWPYASRPPGGGNGSGGGYHELTAGGAGAGASDAPRRCAVQTEEAWWRDWKDVLRLAIVGKRHGWVSLDDLLYYKMLPVHPDIPANPWA